MENGGCEQLCNNMVASFECSCRDGYSLDANRLNCSGECMLGCDYSMCKVMII